MNQIPTTEIDLIDDQGFADLGTYATRAKAVDPAGSMRMVVSGGVLAAYVPIVPGTGVLGGGLVLGLRTYAVANTGDLDITVPLSAITDRTHHRGFGPKFPIPPVQLREPWAAVSPPKSGWNQCGDASADELEGIARRGVEEVANAAGVNPNALAVSDVRTRVWSEKVTISDDVRLPAGLAFASYALGFGAPATLFRSGPWTRLSGPGGHALAR